jgi:SRSO17 transposase
MDAQELRRLRPELRRFLKRFDDCFETASVDHVPIYIAGQLSDLDRKSVEPIAKRAGVPPRTLQEFLSLHAWDEGEVENRLLEIIASEHCGPHRVGLIDETSFVKKGSKTPGVQKQWCGHLGKVENCVVTVHLGYTQGDFQCLLNGELFLPESWHEDRERCRRAGIPEDMVYRPKWQIALELYDRAVAKGVGFDWLTFDEYYGGKPDFLRGLSNRNQLYVAEVPKNIVGWIREAQVTTRTYGREHEPRLLAGTPAPRRLDELLQRHPLLRDQPWTQYRLDNREQGPSVWEVKHVPLWTKNEAGLPGPQQHLIVARHVLREGEVKYFISNAPVNTAIETLLLVALTRHRVERCFQDQKSELGLAHYEGRTYQGLKRHLILSSMSYLFLVRAVLARRGEKSGVDGLPDPQGDRGPDYLVVAQRQCVWSIAGAIDRGDHRDSAGQCESAAVPPEAYTPATAGKGSHPRASDYLPMAAQPAIAL